MDVKISAAPDVVFDQLARLGDYELDGNNLERVEGDTVFYVLRQSVWDRYQRLYKEFEAECAAGKRAWP
jgi:hypothetical protein